MLESKINSPTVPARNLGLTSQLWSYIGNYLSPVEFNHFIRACKLFLQSGIASIKSDDGKIDSSLTQSVASMLYQRLCLIDTTLPKSFITQDHMGEYLAAVMAVTKNQERELAKLNKFHPETFARHYNEVELNKLKGLARIEACNNIIDNINIDVIEKYVVFEGTTLNLKNFNITRLPESLIRKHAEYFNNLEEINCNQNYIKVLSLRNLPMLNILDCEANGMRHLTLENLPSLEHMNLDNNHLRDKLDLSKFGSLLAVSVHNNKLKQIILKGLTKLEHLDCSNNHLRELLIDSPLISDLNCSWNYLTTLTIEYLDHLVLRNDEEDQTQGLSIYENNFKLFPKNLVDKFGQAWANESIEEQREEFGIESETDVNSDTENKRHINILWARARFHVCPALGIAQGPLLEGESMQVSQLAQNEIAKYETEKDLPKSHPDTLNHDENMESAEETSNSEDENASMQTSQLGHEAEIEDEELECKGNVRKRHK